MALLSVLLYVLVVYIRPAEVLPGWDGFPFAAIAQVSAMVVVAVGLLFRPRRFWNQPHDKYVLGFYVSAIVSNIAWGWFGGGYFAMDALAPVVICYFLLRASVRSERQLRWAGYVLVAATLFQAVNGISQFRTGVGLGGVVALEYPTGMSGSEPQPGAVRRIRGTGIFNDPNDLAMAFVAVTPLLIGVIVRRRARLRNRIVATVSWLPIAVALYYTNSRGGILGLGAVLAPFCWRFGKVLGTVAAGIGLLGLVALGPSRMSELDSEESSAQERVQAWSAGLQMFRSQPVFGVGFSRYTEFNERVAHNSFVHTLGELGIVGAFFFVGMVYWLARGTERRTGSAAGSPDRERLREWGRDLRIGGLGWCVCAMFLSRQYDFVLFILLALTACHRQAVQEAEPDAVRGQSALDLIAIVALTVASVIGVYILVRVLVLWG